MGIIPNVPTTIGITVAGDDDDVFFVWNFSWLRLSISKNVFGRLEFIFVYLKSHMMVLSISTLPSSIVRIFDQSLVN